jgi:hypothetical protein
MKSTRSTKANARLQYAYRCIVGEDAVAEYTRLCFAWCLAAAAAAAAMGETQRKVVNGMPRNDVSMTDMSGLDNDPKVNCAQIRLCIVAVVRAFARTAKPILYCSSVTQYHSN